MMEMELELGLGLPPYSSPNNISGCCNLKRRQPNKRSFSQAFQPSTNNNEKLPALLVAWGDKPNKEDHDKETSDDSSSTIMSEVEENDYVVGWPPINSWRKKLVWRQQNNNNQGGGGGGGGRRIWNNQNQAVLPAERGRGSGGGRVVETSYVKVKMHGVVIGRKIDLRLYHSYHELKSALIHMFAKYHTRNMHSRCCSLIYQDRDGDWMLAGDVPWKTFTETARRLEIVKTAGG